MTIRPALAAAVAAFALVGSASAASLIIDVEPTLTSIPVDVPACGDASETPQIPVTWSPERDCSHTGDVPAPEPDPSASADPSTQPPGLEPGDTGSTDDEATDPPVPAEPSAPAVVPDSAPAEPGDDEPGADQPDVDTPTEDTPSADTPTEDTPSADTPTEDTPATTGEAAPDA